MRQFDHNPRAVTTARETAKLSKAELARRVGKTRSLITEIEGGTRNANAELIEDLAKVLGVSPETLSASSGDAAEGTPTPPAASGLSELRDEERAHEQDVPELRGSNVGGA